jgi:hypothetical protein
VRELHAGDKVKVTLQMLDHDAKRMHYVQEMYHAEEGWLACVLEAICMHVDLNAEEVGTVSGLDAGEDCRDARGAQGVSRAAAGGPQDRDTAEVTVGCTAWIPAYAGMTVVVQVSGSAFREGPASQGSILRSTQLSRGDAIP